MTLETQTESALSDYVKKFLLEFKDEKGNFRYVDDIDNMMPSKCRIRHCRFTTFCIWIPC